MILGGTKTASSLVPNLLEVKSTDPKIIRRQIQYTQGHFKVLSQNKISWQFDNLRSPGRQLREAEQRQRLECEGQPGRKQGDQPGRELQERVGAAKGRGPGHHWDPVQVCQQQQSQCSDTITLKLWFYDLKKLCILLNVSCSCMYAVRVRIYLL